MKERIKQIRMEAHMNQSEFGKRIGVSQGNVAHWENGIRTPTEVSIKAICREFNVNYAWLVDGLGEMHFMNDDDYVELMCEKYDMTSPIEKSIIRNYLEMSHNQRMQFIDLVKQLLKEHNCYLSNKEQKESEKKEPQTP